MLSYAQTVTEFTCFHTSNEVNELNPEPSFLFDAEYVTEIAISTSLTSVADWPCLNTTQFLQIVKKKKKKKNNS